MLTRHAVLSCRHFKVRYYALQFVRLGPVGFPEAPFISLICISESFFFFFFKFYLISISTSNGSTLDVIVGFNFAASSFQNQKVSLTRCTVSSHSAPAGGSTHPLSLNGLHSRIQMTRAVFVWVCTIRSVVNNFVSIVVVLNSAIVRYLFAFCVIQSHLCERTLLLFKINPMLK